RANRTCICAPTASTTVRTAGKLATSPWPTAVATEPRFVVLKFERDARLAAGAGGVARYLADAAGMPGEGPAELQAATIKACLEAFEFGAAAHQSLQVSYAVYPDRIEIELAREGHGKPQSVKRLTRHFGEATANT